VNGVSSLASVPDLGPSVQPPPPDRSAVGPRIGSAGRLRFPGRPGAFRIGPFLDHVGVTREDRVMNARLLIPCLAALVACPAIVRAQEPYGTYSYVKGQKGSDVIPEEDLKDSTMKVEEGKITLLGPDGEVQYEIRYDVDEELGDDTYRASMEITKAEMQEAVGAKAKALAKADGSEITIIYDYEGLDYPEDFEPKGPSQHLFVLKRVLATPKADDPN
jgi:hypothetical protein